MGSVLKGVDDIQKLLWSFASHRVITVGVRLGIMRRLSEGECDTDTLARELGLDPTATGKLVRALFAHGLVDARGDAYFVPDHLAACFVPGSRDLRAFIDHSHSMYDSFGENLENWVRGLPWGVRHTQNSDHNHSFGMAMEAMGRNVARQALGALDLTGCSRMLDVGGGFGHYSKTFLGVYKDLSATVLDTPEVAKLARERVAGSELEQRIRFVPGDYLKDDFGEGFDVVLLANILHQELPDAAARIVSKAASALRPGGTVAVLDFSIDEQRREQIIGTLFAINMRSFGDTYNEPIIRAWMAKAGLIDAGREDLSDFRWLLLGRKPGVGTKPGEPR